MSKPLSDNLQSVRVETDDGDLIPIMDFAGEKFGELIAAVTSQNKAGSLTLKVEIKPSTAGALAVKADVVIKKPKGKPAESLLWATPENNLVADDPRQLKMELKSVHSEPTRELKAIGA